MNKSAVLFVTTCLAATMIHQGATAATASQKNKVRKPITHARAIPVQTQAAPKAAAPVAVARLAAVPAPVAHVASGNEAIVVLGAGAARETQTVSHLAIQQYVPGTSPFKALSKLPGVMFTSSDPLGSYEWSQQI